MALQRRRPSDLEYRALHRDVPGCGQVACLWFNPAHGRRGLVGRPARALSERAPEFGLAQWSSRARCGCQNRAPYVDALDQLHAQAISAKGHPRADWEAGAPSDRRMGIASQHPPEFRS
jgi:hypothetical protein